VEPMLSRKDGLTIGLDPFPLYCVDMQIILGCRWYCTSPPDDLYDVKNVMPDKKSPLSDTLVFARPLEVHDDVSHPWIWHVPD
jgi:hypothetical protein